MVGPALESHVVVLGDTPNKSSWKNWSDFSGQGRASSLSRMFWITSWKDGLKRSRLARGLKRIIGRGTQFDYPEDADRALIVCLDCGETGGTKDHSEVHVYS